MPLPLCFHCICLASINFVYFVYAQCHFVPKFFRFFCFRCSREIKRTKESMRESRSKTSSSKTFRSCIRLGLKGSFLSYSDHHSLIESHFRKILLPNKYTNTHGYSSLMLINNYTKDYQMCTNRQRQSKLLPKNIKCIPLSASSSFDIWDGKPYLFSHAIFLVCVSCVFFLSEIFFFFFFFNAAKYY